MFLSKTLSILSRPLIMFRLFSVILILSFCKAPVFCMAIWKDISTERQIELAFDVTPMTIHTFIKLLDYFIYVLDPTYTNYHIPKSKSRCCICSWHCKKDDILLPIWNFCAVSMFLQVMQHLSHNLCIAQYLVCSWICQLSLKHLLDFWV